MKLSEDILKQLGIEYYAGYVSKMYPGEIIYGVELVAGAVVSERDKQKVHRAAEYVQKEYGLCVEIGYKVGLYGDFEEPLDYQFSIEGEIPY